MTTCHQTPLCCGPFVVGERPDPLRYVFLDSAGAPIDLTGYVASFCWAEAWGEVGTGPAEVTDPTGGEVTYTWQPAALASPGRFTGQVWVDDSGGRRYASVPVRYNIAAGICEPAA